MSIPSCVTSSESILISQVSKHQFLKVITLTIFWKRRLDKSPYIVELSKERSGNCFCWINWARCSFWFWLILNMFQFFEDIVLANIQFSKNTYSVLYTKYYFCTSRNFSFWRINLYTYRIAILLWRILKVLFHLLFNSSFKSAYWFTYFNRLVHSSIFYICYSKL